MMKKFDETKALARLEHVRSHLQTDWIETNDIEFWSEKLSNVENFEWGMLFMQSYYLLKIITTWFDEKNIHIIRHYAYNSSKLQYVISKPPYNYWGQSYAYEKRAFEGLWFLVSNHQALIEWYAHFDHIFEKAADNPKSEQFFTRQFFIALRGDWQRLALRCEQVLSDPPKSGRGKNYLIDHQFYLALAKGDMQGMTDAVQQLLETKTFNRRQRMDLETGYSKDLIDTPATLYAKLAWYHGYQIEIDSPYVPKAWLDMTPLEHYQDDFDFMKRFDI